MTMESSLSMEKKEAMTENAASFRPRWHFTPRFGWINDPNGLVCHDGRYELYFQHNPKALVWGNMTWGHAISGDLVHFHELEPSLFPDEEGTMFSGCGIVNEHGLLNLPKDALIYFYTVATHRDETKPESDQPWFKIRLAYSLDGGKTLIKAFDPVLESLAVSNRDPKVFYHEETKAYVMVLWLENHDFGIFRSENLLHFELSDRITLEKGFECPDLFRLEVEGTDEKKWVFWAADGSYYVGSFDGFHFIQEEPRRLAYQTKLPYAAQTYSGTGKVLQIAWLRTKTRGEAFTGMLSLPRELSLQKKEGAYLLQMRLPENVKDILRKESAAAPQDLYYGIEDGWEIVKDCGIVEKTRTDGTDLIILDEWNEA
ncbi:MAG: glycoside hydrolase family 32 protein [Firmicutes bacterium]|nr:glycoside hydrolase family 32 protein [Bacillota bacterium]